MKARRAAPRRGREKRNRDRRWAFRSGRLSCLRQLPVAGSSHARPISVRRRSSPRQRNRRSSSPRHCPRLHRLKRPRRHLPRRSRPSRSSHGRWRRSIRRACLRRRRLRRRRKEACFRRLNTSCRISAARHRTTRRHARPRPWANRSAAFPIWTCLAVFPLARAVGDLARAVLPRANTRPGLRICSRPIVVRSIRPDYGLHC